MTPEPEHPAQVWQKIQPALCGIVLRWTFPDPAHSKQACDDGAERGSPTEAPQLEQK
jgi:hypothetical protein